MKYLIFWAAIILAIYYFSKKKKINHSANSQAQDAASRNQAAQSDTAIVMVECAHCKTHFPNNESIDYLGETFCSIEHKNLGRR